MRKRTLCGKTRTMDAQDQRGSQTSAHRHCARARPGRPPHPPTPTPPPGPDVRGHRGGCGSGGCILLKLDHVDHHAVEVLGRPDCRLRLLGASVWAGRRRGRAAVAACMRNIIEKNRARIFNELSAQPTPKGLRTLNCHVCTLVRTEQLGDNLAEGHRADRRHRRRGRRSVAAACRSFDRRGEARREVRRR